MEGTTYSIWAVPSSDLAKELQAVIDQLSASYGGPVFTPHVTVLGSIPHLSDAEAKKKMKQLSEELRPYTLEFEKIDMLPEFYRAIFVHMKHTPAAIGAFRAAQKIFGYTDDPEHLCHLCLFYGHQTPTEKQRMMQDIYIDMEQSFPVDVLHLYKKPREALAWEFVESFKLRQK